MDAGLGIPPKHRLFTRRAAEPELGRVDPVPSHDSFKFVRVVVIHTDSRMPPNWRQAFRCARLGTHPLPER